MDEPIFDENQINRQQAQFLHWYTGENVDSEWLLNDSRIQRLLQAKTEIQRRNLRPKMIRKHYGGTTD